MTKTCSPLSFPASTFVQLFRLFSCGRGSVCFPSILTGGLFSVERSYSFRPAFLSVKVDGVKNTVSSFLPQANHPETRRDSKKVSLSSHSRETSFFVHIKNSRRVLKLTLFAGEPQRGSGGRAPATFLRRSRPGVWG